MKTLSLPRHRRSQAGVALLIAIFVLLLVGVTAIALIMSASTESALAGNYRSSASAQYAALAGLEEARGRLLPNNPDYLAATIPLPSPLPLGQAVYIINPLPGETVNPTDLSNPSTYPDTEYGNEFAGTPYATPTVVGTPNSVSPVPGLPGPLYKWVRINAVTEKSLKVDVNADGTFDSSTPLYYDYACADTPAKPGPGPNLCLIHSPNAVQALEVTALASLPGNGTQKLLQYIVAPLTPNLNFGGGSPNPNLSFPAALMLDGNNVAFQGPSSTAFNINGNDHVGTCGPGAPGNPIAAIGYTNGSDSSETNILNGINPPNVSHYSGLGTSPNVIPIPLSGPNGLPANYQTPSGLDALVQQITQGADEVVNGPVMQTDSQNIMPPGMSNSNPMTVVVNGDLTIYNWHGTGYGLLVVTGTLSYDPDASWNGIILVVGQGQFISTKAGIGKINGAVLVAKTRDASGNLLPNLGAASFKQTNGGLGIYYSTSCLNAAASRPLKYQVLSYHQLSQ